MNIEMKTGWFAMLGRVRNEVLSASGGFCVGCGRLRGSLVN